MSELDDFMTAGLAEASTIIGKVSFTIAGVFGVFYGTIDRHAASQTLHQEGAGFVLKSAATIVADRSQFQAKPANGAVLTVSTGEAYEIGDVEDDTISYTFKLTNRVS